MRQMAAAFTEADLVRFFNSLAETENSLRDAAHPRYMLEIGLIKLLEMRSVMTIEDILTKLDNLGLTATKPVEKTSAATAPGSSPAPAAATEKKTLNADLPPQDLAFKPRSTAPPPRVEPPRQPAGDDVFEGHVEEILGETPPDLVEPEQLFHPKIPTRAVARRTEWYPLPRIRPGETLGRGSRARGGRSFGQRLRGETLLHGRRPDADQECGGDHGPFRSPGTGPQYTARFIRLGGCARCGMSRT